MLQGVVALAVSDDLIKKSPSRAGTVTKPLAGIGARVVARSDDRVEAVIDAHPEEQRLIAVLMAGTGLRIAEALAVSIDEFDFVHHVLHVRRQLKKLGTEHVWALPKNDLERDVPLASWVEDAAYWPSSRSTRHGRSRWRGSRSTASSSRTRSSSGGRLTTRSSATGCTPS